jgi:hypothetical protein
MRTAIFVYESTTITIKSSDADLKVVPYGAASSFAATGDPQPVSPNLYKIVSSSAVSVSSDASSTVVMTTTNDKDQWPDPPAALPSTMASTTDEQICGFFADARSLAS